MNYGKLLENKHKLTYTNFCGDSYLYCNTITYAHEYFVLNFGFGGQNNRESSLTKTLYVPISLVLGYTELLHKYLPCSHIYPSHPARQLPLQWPVSLWHTPGSPQVRLQFLEQLFPKKPAAHSVKSNSQGGVQ